MGRGEGVWTKTLSAGGPRSLLDGSQRELEDTTEMTLYSGRD